MDDGDKDDRVVDYASPDTPSQRKNAADYYREPPAMASWTIWDLVIWIVGFLGLLALLLWLIGRWLHGVGI
jgi:hypothetical protein